MSIIFGFLFNRFSFLVIVVVVVLLLVVSGRLVWNKYIGAGLLALVLGIGLWTAYESWEKDIRADERGKVVAEYNVKISAQKAEAAKRLADLTAEMNSAKDALRELISNLEKERENNQAKNTADLRARRAGPGLRFSTTITGCGESSRITQAGAAKPAGDAATAVVQLPEPLNGNLLEFAADAQSLAIDYAILYKFANDPSLVCEVRRSPTK